MSYILDALKKSDQERQQNNGPSLQTVHRPHLINKRAGSRNAFILLLLVIVALLASGVWYLYGGSIKFEQPRLAVEPVDTPRPAPMVSPPEPVEPAYTQPVEFSQLPDPVQQEIPALTFSFHVYSDNPERRTIIINKRRVREGDAVSPGLLLEAITQQGVVLQWQNQHRFTINVVESW